MVNLKLKDGGPFKLMPEFLKKHIDHKDNHDAYSSSDETIIYWHGAPDDLKADSNLMNKPAIKPVPVRYSRKHQIVHSELKPQKRRVIHSKPSKVRGGFKITLHGIARRQHKYYFRCYIQGCNSKFNSLKEWNSHHLVQHKSLLWCLRCPKEFKKPSAFRVH